MKKYVKPSVQMIARNELDIIRTSELLFPIIPLTGNYTDNPEAEEV